MAIAKAPRKKKDCFFLLIYSFIIFMHAFIYQLFIKYLVHQV